MLEPDVESLPWEEQRAFDDARFREQISYLLERSAFYREKLAGVDARLGLAEIAGLPLTEKDELRRTRTPENPFGTHVCAEPHELVRVYSTSGTTGEPSYIPLTAGDLDNWVTGSARSYAASGVIAGQRIVSTYNAGPFVAGAALAAFDRIGLCHVPVGTGNTERLVQAIERLRPEAAVLTPSYAASGVAAGERIVSTYNAGPFVAGAALAAFDRIGLCHIPVGTGNTERLVQAIERLRPEAAVLTPSYAAYLAESHDLRESSVRRVLVAGEPGGGEPGFRARLEDGWGANVTEAMGIGDIGVSLWGECEQQDGMHLGARGFVHAELIDPATGAARELADGASGELVLTHLRHRAAPLLRFRTRDHVEVRAAPCPCGRTSPRIRCVGRTDDMLIVRGVNVFPAAIREVVGAFAPDVSGQILLRPRAAGVKQEPPLPVSVELAEAARAPDGLADAIGARIRELLLVRADIALVPWGSLQRSEYKSKLVERP